MLCERLRSEAADSARESSDVSVQYLALCRVVMGKTVRVKTAGAAVCQGTGDSASAFPVDDPAVGTLFIADDVRASDRDVRLEYRI